MLKPAENVTKDNIPVDTTGEFFILLPKKITHNFHSNTYNTGTDTTVDILDDCVMIMPNFSPSIKAGT